MFIRVLWNQKQSRICMDIFDPLKARRPSQADLAWLKRENVTDSNNRPVGTLFQMAMKMDLIFKARL